MRQLLGAILVLAAVSAGAQSGRDDTIALLTARPYGLLPLASENTYFTTGGGGGVALDLPLPFLPSLAVRVAGGYAYLPIWTADGANLVSASGGVALSLSIGSRLSGEISGGAGYYYGIIGDGGGTGGGNAAFSAALRFGYAFGPSFDQGIEVSYEAALDGLGGLLYHGLGIGLSTRFGFLRRRELQIDELELQRIFPVLYKRYTDHGFGHATLSNAGSKPMEDLQVSFHVEQFMDSPWQVPAPGQIASGERVPIDVVALFSETALLSVTEATVVTGTLTVRYTLDDREHVVERSAPLRIQDRHGITWDDDRKAAAYVTYKDPTLVDIANEVARVADSRQGVVDANLRIAMALHEAFREYDLTYRVDPSTPYIEYSESTDAVDYLQFPRNTLRRRAGDCDDLSILYAAALQAVGVETAFITIPGHLYGAFALKAPPDQAQRLLSDPSQLIIHDGRAWVPIEFTLVNGSFLEAWQVGAQQWRTHEATGDAVIYPLYQAWNDYEPVGQVGEYDSAEFLNSDQIVPLFAAQLDRFIEREIFAQTERLKQRVDAGRADAATYNRLGAVYARYGRLDQARDYFLEASRDRSHVPSLINLANLAMLEGELPQAIAHLERAESISPRDPYVKIQLARVHSRLGDFGRSAEYYQDVEEAAPELAAQFAHLDVDASAATRASGRQAMEEVMLWIEDSGAAE